MRESSPPLRAPTVGHHLAHLPEAPDQVAHLLGAPAAAARDARRAALVDDLGLRPLGGSHRADQRLDLAELALVDLLGERAEHRQLREHLAQRPELLDHLQLLEQIFEAEAAGEQALGVLLGFGLVDDLLEIADQADHVAHPEDARREPLRAEGLEPVEGLAGADEADRNPGDRLHREGGAAARIAIELGQDQAVERELLGEGLRDLHRVAAHQRVAHEQRVRGGAHAVDLGQLLHQLGVDREPTRRVVDDRVEALAARAAGRRGADLRRPLARGARVDGDLDAGAELLQLEHGGGSLHVGGDQQHAAPLAGEMARELRGHRRLADALEPEQHHAR